MFGNPGWCRRRHGGRQRWQAAYALAGFVLGLSGCGQTQWPQHYADARLKLQQGYYQDAIDEAEEGNRQAESKDPVWAWRFRILAAEGLVRRREPKRALARLGPEPPPDSPLEIRVRRGIIQAQAWCQSDQRQQGEIILNHAAPGIPPTERGLLAELALTRGFCAFRDRAASQQFFSEAIQLAHNSDNYVEATAVVFSGYLLLQDQRYTEAIDKFGGALGISGSPFLQEKSLGNLGFAYSQLGNWKNAISYSQQALILAEQIKNVQDQEAWLIDLGKAHFALWELPEAENAYLHALSVAHGLQDNPNTALCLHNLALLALRRNDVAKAEAYRKEGEALNVEGERLHFALDAADIAAARGQYTEAERLGKQLLVETRNNADVHSIVEQKLGRVYWHEAKYELADQMFRSGIDTAERAVRQFKRPEDRMSFMDKTPFYDPYIQFLVARNRSEDALRIAERGRAQVLAATVENGQTRDPSITASGLRALSKQRKQIVLSYSMTDEKTFLWVITPSEVQLFQLQGHHDLAARIIDFNQEIQSHPNLEESPAAARLYDALIQPATALIPRQSSVVIIPSKILSLINFEALIATQPQPHYWIEDVDVQVAGSLELLSRPKSSLRRPPVRAKDLLLLGAPLEASKDFPVLKNAPEEIQRVRSHFSTELATVISGSAATADAYRASSPGRYRFLHFDTHGVASDLSPLDSAIVLSPGADGSYKLYAREIKDIPLHADLVTISACSGSGTRWYQGEGLVGLAWAFMRAGAHQVVGALWEVDEASSPQLMDDFYTELTQGKSAAEALRDAKLKMLHSGTFYRHPYYWASLQLYTGS